MTSTPHLHPSYQGSASYREGDATGPEAPAAPVSATRSRRRPRTKAWLAAAGVATGLTLGSAGIAAAATGGSSSSSTPSSASASSGSAAAPSGSAPAGNPASLSHGPGETALTGTTATKAEAAAKAAVPGATVVRAETDAQGAAYEVHMRKSDGTYVTVKLDANFEVTATDTGFA